MGKIIAVASGKGGTGKTTTVAAVSSCLAVLGHKTLCIDFDAGLKNLDLALCMNEYTIADYTDVLRGRLDLMDACHEHPMLPNLFFLAAPQTRDPEPPNSRDVLNMLDEARNKFDYCFVDSPSGIGEGFRLAHTGADMSVIVTIGELPAMRDAQRAAEIARTMGTGELRLLVNRVLPDNYKKLRTTIDNVIDAVGAQLLGVVREDLFVVLSLHENTPLVLYNKRLSAYDFFDAARRITGENVPLRQFSGARHIWS